MAMAALSATIKDGRPFMIRFVNCTDVKRYRCYPKGFSWLGESLSRV